MVNEGETADVGSVLIVHGTEIVPGDAIAATVSAFSHKITTTETMGVTAGPTKTVSTLSHALEADAIAPRVCPAKT